MELDAAQPAAESPTVGEPIWEPPGRTVRPYFERARTSKAEVFEVTNQSERRGNFCRVPTD